MITAAAAAKSLRSCLTLCDPIDSSPPGSPTPGILQARILEWVAISSSNAWKWKVKVKSLSRVWLLATPWTAAHQAPPSMGFSRQEYWSGVPMITTMHQTAMNQNSPPNVSSAHNDKKSGDSSCSKYSIKYFFPIQMTHQRYLNSESCSNSWIPSTGICRPGTGKPGGLPSMGSHRVGHDWSDLAAAAAYI